MFLQSILQQVSKTNSKMLLRKINETRNLINFYETYKIGCKRDPDFDGFDKEDIKEILGFMNQDRLVDEKQKFINLGLNYINQTPIFQNKKQAHGFEMNKNNILEQINLFQDQSGWDLKTRISFESEKRSEEAFSASFKNKIDSFQNQPATIKNELPIFLK